MSLPTSTRLITDGPLIDVLSTAVAWADAGGTILGVNPAFARWMGVSARRLLGQPLAALEMDGDAMARLFEKKLLRDTDRDVLRLQRMALGLPGETQRFAGSFGGTEVRPGRCRSARAGRRAGSNTAHGCASGR